MQRGNSSSRIAIEVASQTHDGYVLDAARDPSAWERVKDKVLRPGMSWTSGLVLEVLKSKQKSTQDFDSRLPRPLSRKQGDCLTQAWH